MNRGPLKINAAVAKWLAGFGTSLLGDQIYFLALSWAAVQVAEPAMVGLILAAGSIPRALILLVGGALADRLSPKLMIMVSDAGRTIAMVIFALVLTFGTAGPIALAAIALIFGILDGLFLPAVGALPPRIAAAHQMARVQAVKTVIQRFVILLGAPLAGWTVANSGLANAFWLSAVLFAVSVGALALITLNAIGGADQPRVSQDQPELAVDPDGPRRSSVMKDIVAGLRSIKSHPVLPLMLTVLAVTDLGFTGPMSTGLPLLAKQDGWGATGVGYILGGFGLGAATTGLTLALIRRIPRAGLVGYVALAFMGAGVVIIGLAHSLLGAVVASVAIGMGSGVFGTVVNALLITTTPIHELGRVMSVLSLASYGGVPISYALTGVLTGVTSAEVPFYVGGGLVLLAAVAALSQRRLRQLELFGAPAEGTGRADR